MGLMFSNDDPGRGSVGTTEKTGTANTSVRDHPAIALMDLIVWDRVFDLVGRPKGPQLLVSSTGPESSSQCCGLPDRVEDPVPHMHVHYSAICAKQRSMAETNPRRVGIGGPLKGTAFPLPAGEVSIGRDSSNHLWAPDPALSRKHCLVVASDAEVSIRDLGSRNGTLVNGVPVEQQQMRQGALRKRRFTRRPS